MSSPTFLDRADAHRLDRYELIGELASGGMATVYLARLAGMGGFQRFVAIKRLHPHLSKETEFVQMFLDEARLAASIHHPHVVPILEVGTSQSGYYVVMEYVEGDTLAGLMVREANARTTVPAPIMLRIALDALSGLHAAHELRDESDRLVELVHRDISPQNVLVGVDGSARITDFGVARATTRLAQTRSGTLKGKLAYMPPEQAKGGGGAIDRRADVFAMGVVVWEALAGRRLFKGDTELETFNRLIFEPVPTIGSVLPSMPRSIDEAVMGALERDPAKRYPTAADFGDALERAAHATLGVASVRETAGYVHRMLNEELQQQRTAVRAWLAQNSESSANRAAARENSDVDGVAPTLPRPRLSSFPMGISQQSTPQSLSAMGAMSLPDKRLPSLRPEAMSLHEHAQAQPSRLSPLLVAPLALAVLSVAAFVGWSLSQASSSSSTSLPMRGSSSAAPAASSAPEAAPPPPPSSSAPSPNALSIDALPAADKLPGPAGTSGRPLRPGSHALGQGGRAAAPPSPPAGDRPPAPPAPPPADPPGDGYKNPYR